MTEIENIDISRDQFEALLLCDREGYSQEEAGAKMGISRGTIQRLLYDGRKKILEAIYNNQGLTINLNDKEDKDACMHTFHGCNTRG